MKRVIALMIMLGLGTSMISCSDDYAAVEKNVIKQETMDPGDSGDGGGDGGDNGGGGIPPTGG